LQESYEKLRQILGLNWEVSKIGPLHSKFALGPHHVSKYGRHPFRDR